MRRSLIDLAMGGSMIAVGIAVWIKTYHFFEKPPLELASSGPLKWQRRPAIIAWIAAACAALIVGFLFIEISN